MVTEVNFYHLTRSSLEDALPRLLQKTLQAGERAGLFSNNTQLSNRLRAAGSQIGEKLWRMPLGPKYDKLIDSDIADMKNVSNGRDGGSITAAQFLQRFVQEGVAWAHLDIAGMAWSTKGNDTTPKGATAFGVRLLDKWVADNYER